MRQLDHFVKGQDTDNNNNYLHLINATITTTKSCTINLKMYCINGLCERLS